MKEIILGTAGHIDHGKTSLVRALTGTDTDRLKEEKKRGITIELGFAALNLPDGRRLGVVDVPGHEKFVKNMVAGASGIDIVAMIIAADEGVMPQTREHLEICSLLGIRHGLVVLTKSDMVDEEWLEMVTDDVRDFLSDSFLADAPLIPVSSHTGKGLDTLIQAISDMASLIPDIRNTTVFRLPVDRVFTMKGFGTVITGTLVSGSVSVGDTVMVYPELTQSRVRGLQVHNDSVQTAVCGQRTAVNFQGLDLSEVQRGDVIAPPDALKNTFMVDTDFHYLGSNEKPLKNRTKVRFHTGTSEITALTVLLDRDTLEPGEKAPVQFRFDRPMVCVRDDRYVVRSYSPIRTIGGGAILNPVPRKHKRFQDNIIEGLSHLSEAGSEEAAAFHLMQAGFAGASMSDLRLVTNLSEKQLTAVLQKLLSSRSILVTDKDAKTYIHADAFQRLCSFATNYLEKYHASYPLREGLSKEELKSKFPAYIQPRLLNQVLNQLVKDEKLSQEGDLVRLSTHKVALQVDQEALRLKILENYENTGITPPYFREIVRTLDKAQAEAAPDVMKILIRENLMVRVKEDFYFHRQALDSLQEKVVAFLLENEEMNPSQFKDICGGIARKYVIPLMEYFDGIHLTIRIGDTRKLRKQQPRET
ncbi:selenocysteine-specific elongation factor [Desulfobotulus alkaliphilus]|uniref:Selenocysteine-specific elongation factor n=1 Tax=Desulfobotulus alkaliphilus TaxID=622671 RepID=A0A562R543_9BACT|nr:selenocysteine-specific translation elongation factor [Desulfobotulus alkaliphilus]TWI64179.1 selenocysteine-specific elongation factor [Desulfobotulus alkaliphilus]